RMLSEHKEYGGSSTQVGHAFDVNSVPNFSRINTSETPVTGTGGSYRPRKAPPVCMEHRKGPQIRGTEIKSCVECHRERLKKCPPMVIHDTLGCPCSTARV